MPTILMLSGWRLFFYSNEGDEPIHIHCSKGSMEAKYWIHERRFDIEEAYAYGLSNNDRKQVRRVVFEHYGYIIGQWNEFKARK